MCPHLQLKGFCLLRVCPLLKAELRPADTASLLLATSHSPADLSKRSVPLCEVSAFMSQIVYVSKPQTNSHTVQQTEDWSHSNIEILHVCWEKQLRDCVCWRKVVLWELI